MAAVAVVRLESFDLVSTVTNFLKLESGLVERYTFIWVMRLFQFAKDEPVSILISIFGETFVAEDKAVSHMIYEGGDSWLPSKTTEYL